MIKIVIHTAEGETSIITNATEVRFVKLCPYLEDHEFLTANPNQRFCCDAHRAHYYRKVALPLPVPPSKAVKTPA